MRCDARRCRYPSTRRMSPRSRSACPEPRDSNDLTDRSVRSVRAARIRPSPSEEPVTTRKRRLVARLISSLAVAALAATALSATALAAPAAADTGTSVTPQDATGAGGSYNGLALTPPMGFNDWYQYRCGIS